MERRFFMVTMILLGLFAAPVYAQRITERPRDLDNDRPHEDGCIRAGILRNPDVLMAGDHFVMVVGLQNRCRHIALVNVDIYLARDDFRVQIGSGQVALDGPEGEMLYLRPMVPRHIRSGRYSLVMVARERGGSIELDRTGVHVRNPHRLRPYDDRPEHLESGSDNGPVDGLENDLGAVRPQMLGGDATGTVAHLSTKGITVEQKVGPTVSLDIDAATVVEDRHGNPAKVYKGDRVHVEFTGDHADKIIVLGS